jgi:ElaB/YqjD/DUF883 family membrane-anchored ribosome-binding protein
METNGRGNTREGLLNDLRLLIKDAEELLRGGQGYQVVRERVESTLDNARDGLSTMATGARDAMDTADQYVKEHPWQSVGIGALAGLVIGMLISRRSDGDR